MNPYNSDGFNRQEEIRLKSITRNRLTGALAQEALVIAALVTSLIGRINEKGFRDSSVDRLWTAVQNSPRLRYNLERVDRLAGTYPEFMTQAQATRANVERQQRARIEEAKRPQLFQKRFANTHIRHGAYISA